MGLEKPIELHVDVVKTTPNNFPSHVGYDTSTQVRDTSTVDLEKTYWINMGSVCPERPSFTLLSLLLLLSNAFHKMSQKLLAEHSHS